MYVTVADIDKMNTELKDVVDALRDGVAVHYKDPVDGWVQVKQLSVFRTREDYCIGQPVE